MNLNIFLAVAIAVMVVTTSGLGGHLASTKKWHKWFFWGGGGVMLILITIQTFQNEHAQQKLQAQLDQIQKNTERPQWPPRHTHVAFNRALHLTGIDKSGQYARPLVLRVGKRLVTDVAFHRSGDYPVRNPSNIEAKIYFRSPSSMNEVDAMFAEFKGHSQFVPTQSILTESTQGVWRTFFSSVLSDKDVKGLVRGTLVVYVFAAVRWEDETGHYETRFCQCTQPPLVPNNPMWHIIDKYNDEVKLP